MGRISSSDENEVNQDSDVANSNSDNLKPRHAFL